MAIEECRARTGTDNGDVSTGARSRWPDFIGIGTIKSGTTWLWECLRGHPLLFLPRMKELEFFDTRYDLGADWYRSFFEKAAGRVCGEISPQYMHCPQSCGRMEELAGRVKLIVCFRNPVDRAFSHYLMDARAETGLSYSEKAREFDALVRQGGTKYVQFGHYADQIEPYVARFGRAAIHPVFFDDIAADPVRVIRGVCEFLGVASDYVPDKLGTRVNASKRYRSARLFSFLQGGVRTMERVGLGRLVLNLKRTGLRDRVLEIVEVRDDYEPMLPVTRRRLTEIYADGNVRLGRLFGRDLASWNRA